MHRWRCAPGSSLGLCEGNCSDIFKLIRLDFSGFENMNVSALVVVVAGLTHMARPSSHAFLFYSGKT